jgi:hypothetical protein
MSNARFCIIPARALGDTRISRNDVMVLLALGKFGDKDGWSWPSMKTIAEMIQAHHVSVSKSIKTLIDCGYVQSRPRYRDDGSQTSNEYRILFDQPAEQSELDFAKSENTPPEHTTPPADSLPPHSVAAMPPIASETMPPIAHTLCLMKDPTLTPQMNEKNISPNVPFEGDKTKHDGFEEFWNLWPKARRCEKPHAKREFQAAIRKTSPETLLAAVKVYIQSAEALEGFAPYPAKWLKRERWLECEVQAEGQKTDIDLATLGGDAPGNQFLLQLLKYLRAQFGDAMFRSWFAGLRYFSTHQGVLTLVAPSAFIAEWIKAHHGVELKKAACMFFPEIREIEISANFTTPKRAA